MFGRKKICWTKLFFDFKKKRIFDNDDIIYCYNALSNKRNILFKNRLNNNKYCLKFKIRIFFNYQGF